MKGDIHKVQDFITKVRIDVEQDFSNILAKDRNKKVNNVLIYELHAFILCFSLNRFLYYMQ